MSSQANQQYTVAVVYVSPKTIRVDCGSGSKTLKYETYPPYAVVLNRLGFLGFSVKSSHATVSGNETTQVFVFERVGVVANVNDLLNTLNSGL
jgi:hypothetical protein